MSHGYEIEEFNEDGAMDERDSLIEGLVQRIEAILEMNDFSGIEISAVRANIAILAVIVGQCGGSQVVERTKVETWAQIIDQPFTDEKMWGFTPWPEEVKKEWRAGCQKTIQKLLAVLEG